MEQVVSRHIVRERQHTSMSLFIKESWHETTVETKCGMGVGNQGVVHHT
ncbi:MAG: hypothetical protein HQL84_03730 [Magnetococcales bacterium]|nr:hypothetical protein [Magnetococcales bacterium]MBF0149135.1 hypothetical protein [Magnetococcales bacterium]